MPMPTWPWMLVRTLGHPDYLPGRDFRASELKLLCIFENCQPGISAWWTSQRPSDGQLDRTLTQHIVLETIDLCDPLAPIFYFE